MFSKHCCFGVYIKSFVKEVQMDIKVLNLYIKVKPNQIDLFLLLIKSLLLILVEPIAE